MKKLLTILLLTASATALAGPHHGHVFKHHGHRGYLHGSSNTWIAPAIIGGVVTYALTRPYPHSVVVEQQPVIVQPQQNCTAWKEIQNQDGTIYRERTCYGLQ